jgi:hypothetical protein
MSRSETPGAPGPDAIAQQLDQLEASVERMLGSIERRSHLPDAAEAGEVSGLDEELALWRSASFPGYDDADHPFQDALRSGNAAVAALNSERVHAANVGSSEPAREAHQHLYDALAEAKNHLQTAQMALDRARREMR